VRTHHGIKIFTFKILLVLKVIGFHKRKTISYLQGFSQIGYQIYSIQTNEVSNVHSRYSQ
jgi:hypothetical protein